VPTDQFSKTISALKSHVKTVNDHLKNKTFMVGDKFSVADISVACTLMIPFQTVLDAGYRKAMPNVSAWFERCMSLPCFVKTFGYVRMCDKAMKPWDGKAAAAPVAPAKKAEQEEEDLDLFGDDDE
jgi:elongation factor 1-gamma